MSLDDLPGGAPQLKKRELHFYWILDTSGSMEADGKIQALNEAIRQAAPLIREAASNDARGNMMVHAIEFNDGARWVNADLATGVPGSAFEWQSNLKAEGQTDMGQALELVATEMQTLPNNAFRPVICLVTDGQPTDNFSGGLKKLMDVGWGKYAYRLAIAIGDDADLETCKQFIGNPELKPMRASSVADLKKFIRFVSMVASNAAKGGQDVKAEVINQAAADPNAIPAVPGGSGGATPPPPPPSNPGADPNAAAGDTW